MSPIAQTTYRRLEYIGCENLPVCSAGTGGIRLQRWGECHGKLKFAQT
jgi:hypothetical protein